MGAIWTKEINCMLYLQKEIGLETKEKNIYLLTEVQDEILLQQLFLWCWTFHREFVHSGVASGQPDQCI